ARLEKEQEAQREKTIIVTSDLEEIEAQHQSEQQELEGLRQKLQALEESLAKTREDLSQAQDAMQSLQGILQREQGEASEGRGEVTGSQVRLQELTSTAARLEEQSRRLVHENAALQERINSADLTHAAAAALDHRLEAVERLMEAARQQGGTAREAAADSRKA